MSNTNNKHIPEDLDSLTRKDMVELFKIQVEEHQGFIKENQELRTQLAKANERVKELELVIVAITHADETGYVDDVGFIEGWSDVCDEAKALLNKFAIEKKAEGVKGFVESFKFLDDAHCVNIIEVRDAASHYIDEQLRKEQEHG